MTTTSSTKDNKPMDSSSQQVVSFTKDRTLDEVWEENYEQVHKFYLEHNHLTLPKDDPNFVRLARWLTSQRHHRVSLKPYQLEKLKKINYKTVKIHRADIEAEWMSKYKQFELYRRTKAVKMTKMDNALSCWLKKQRSLYRSGLLLPARQELLQKYNVLDPSMKEKDTTKPCVAETKAQRAKWMKQYEQLKAYRDAKGNCNIPKHYPENQTLANWCGSQKGMFRRMQQGLSHMPQYRIELLKTIGFELPQQK
mmetsp:Transcript_5030/g.12001  ORF Transcript_5030/g.12001 Transcript_5030/m.12001 type:complete len:252 (+) Transcript_5030:161-916(+)